jgi:hypothetical protein
MGKFDEAIRSAFVLLEERLREAVNEDSMTGTRLADFAFDPEKGSLAKHLGRTKQERLGLNNIYTGAFRLFRNPTAHGFIGYDADEGKSILYLVNLLLIFLDRAVPPPDTFIEPVEHAIQMVGQEIGPNEASRLRMFLGKCQKLGLKPWQAKNWLPFRAYAMQTRSQWEEAKPHRITLFYIIADQQNPGLWFPVNQYYKFVVGLDTAAIKSELRKLEFVPTGKSRDYRLNLRDKNDQAFFDALFQLVQGIDDKFKATL